MKNESFSLILPDDQQRRNLLSLAKLLLSIFFLSLVLSELALANSIPGTDRSNDLTAMGDLMKTLATIIVDWVCPLIAVLASLSGGAHVLRQNWALAGSCFLGAAIFAIPVAIVRGFFTMGGGQALFG